MKLMEELKSNSVDMILSDPPYNTSECHWDHNVNLNKLWKLYDNIIKENGAIVLTAIQPFTSRLVISNLNMFKYSLVWQKSRTGHFAQAPYRPLTEHEDILIFSKAGTAHNAKPRMKYNPQGVKEYHKKVRGKGYSEHRPVRTKQEDYIQEKTNYPRSVLYFKSVAKPVHPTQKPIALFEYLIRTYTDEDDLVLDNFAGSGTTGVACINSNRRFLLIEQDDKYLSIINNRIHEAKQQLKLF